MIASAHHRAARGLVGLCAAAIVAGLAPSAASAGAYDVQVCRNGHGNSGALTAGGAPGFDWLVRVSNNCDGGWHGWNGISASITHGDDSPRNEPHVPNNTSANIYTAAPAGAAIRKIHVDAGRMASYYGNTTGWNARVMVPSMGWCVTDGQVGDNARGGNCGFGWNNAADNSGQHSWASPDYPGYTDRDIGPITGNVADMAIGVVCNGGSTIGDCYRPVYKPAAGVAIVSAAISVVDNTPPAISGISGQLAAGGWNRPGAIGFGVTGWDNTGIQTFEKFVDGGYTGQTDQPCNYGAMKPCEDRSINDSVSVGSNYDGAHTVTIRARSATQYWLDCAVDCADTSVTVYTDGNGPGAPAAANRGPAWTNANAFNINAPTPTSENDPDGGGPQARAPIARRVVTVCPAGQTSGANCSVKDANPVSGSNQVASAGGVTVPGEGQWQATVTLVDQAGNIGAPSAHVPLRLDLTPPSFAVNQARGGFSIVATDALSQTASITYRLDGKGEWITTSGQADKQDPKKLVVTVEAPVGQHYVEVKGKDNAGNSNQSAQRFDVTVPQNSENVSGLDPFGADSQLAVVDRGETNGLGGGEQATLTASFVRSPKSKNTKPLTVRTINERGTASIAGQLVDGQGRAISNARIDLGASIAGGRTELKKGAAQTDEAGRFTIPLGKGLTSRGLTVAYMARVNDVRPAASAGVELVVKARATFKVHRPRVGKTKFTGFVSSGYLTKQGVEVKLQWKVGKRFRTFTTTRTDIKGRWKTSWTFERRGARYVMRALVTSSPAYAYKGASSRSRVVRIK